MQIFAIFEAYVSSNLKFLVGIKFKILKMACITNVQFSWLCPIHDRLLIARLQVVKK